jgi:hypothetical protein
VVTTGGTSSPVKLRGLGGLAGIHADVGAESSVSRPDTPLMAKRGRTTQNACP